MRQRNITSVMHLMDAAVTASGRRHRNIQRPIITIVIIITIITIMSRADTLMKALECITSIKPYLPVVVVAVVVFQHAAAAIHQAAANRQALAVEALAVILLITVQKPICMARPMIGIPAHEMMCINRR
jgi:hypothetical protein